jgi:integrase
MKTFDTVEHAARHRRHELGRRDRGDWVAPELGRVSFTERADAYLSARVHRRLSTVARDATYVRTLLLPYFRGAIGRFTPADCKAWVASMIRAGKAPATIHKAAQIARGIFDEAVADGIIPRSPWVGIRLPKIERHNARFLSVDEVERLADLIDARYRTLVRTLAYTGIRFGEAGALRVGDVDARRRKLSITRTLHDDHGVWFGPPKTPRSERLVGIPTSLAEEIEALRARRDDADLLFTSPDGGPLRKTWRRRFFVPATRAAGLDRLRVHDLRHTAVSLLIDQGVGPAQIAARLGHEDVRVTLSVYGHLFDAHDDVTTDAMDRAIAARAESVRSRAVIALAASETS